jgi:hypothetical protein
MNTTSPEQFAAAYQSNLETLFVLAHTTFAGVEKVLELNLNVVKANLQDSAGSARALFSVKDPHVAEGQIAEANKKLVALIDTAAKNAPAGSETAVAMMKSAVAAANSTYDSLSKATKQAVEIAEANVAAATNAAVKTAGRAATSARTKKA